MINRTNTLYNLIIVLKDLIEKRDPDFTCMID